MNNLGALLEILTQADKKISAFFCHSPAGVCKYTKLFLKAQSEKG